jgi:hypothetical protein
MAWFALLRSPFAAQKEAKAHSDHPARVRTTAQRGRPLRPPKGIVRLGRYGSYKIRQQAIRGRVQAGIFFGEGEAREDVGFEINI